MKKGFCEARYLTIPVLQNMIPVPQTKDSRASKIDYIIFKIFFLIFLKIWTSGKLHHTYFPSFLYYFLQPYSYKK